MTDLRALETTAPAKTRPSLKGALRRSRMAVGVVAALTATATLLTACVGGAASPGGGSSGDGTALHLVAFSVPKEADGAAEKAFAQTPAGQGVTWQESYGASGDQSRAVVNGLKADVVHFSLEPDVTRLVKANLVDPAWNSGPTKGIVSSSVVVIVVPKGNPQHITGWADLTKPGVKIITPNPASSGSARWNILAAYQQVIAGGGTEAQAKDYLTKFFANVVALPGSGRDATNAFLHGTGNVLISYENDAILARQSGESFDYLVPDATLKIENPAAVVKGANPKASEFLAFLSSTAGQEEFVKKGFRPVVDGTPIGTVRGANDPAKPFPAPAQEFTIADLGGWDKVTTRFFDEKTGIVPAIQKATGKAQ